MALTQVDQGLLGQYAQYTGFKNRIINGAMMIDQRNAGASYTPTALSGNPNYSLDRWTSQITQASKFTVQRNAGSVTPPAGFINYLGITSSSAYSVGASDYFVLAQLIEGLNIADLGWGTANAQTVTLSFRVYSSLTGTFSGSLTNDGTLSYVFNYTISAANTWTTVSVTIVGPTSGTWLTTNGIGVYVRLGLGCGSSFTTSTVGSWTSGNYVQSTGSTSVVGTNGATFYITGVQLEKGSTATSFDYRPYGTELQLCQRYYIKYLGSDSAGGYATFFLGMNSSATAFVITPFFPVPLRAPNPTQTWGGTLRLLYPGGATSALSGISASNQQIGVTGGYGAYNVSNTGYATAGVIGISGGGDTSAYWAFSSEL